MPTFDFSTMKDRVIVQCHSGDGIFSRLIKWFTRSSVSHISILIYAGDLDGEEREWTILEAVEGEGVREVGLEAYQKSYHARKIDFYSFVVPFEKEESVEFLSALRKEIGAKYDWLGVFRFVTRRRHAHDKKWFCSEFLDYHAADFNRPLFNNTASWEVKPGDVPRSPALRKRNVPF